MKKRLYKKYIKQVSEGQRSGRKIPFFYVSKVRDIAAEYFDYQYLMVFRPWWYDQNWSDFDIGKEWNRHYEETGRKFEAKWGIDLGLLNKDYKQRRRAQVRKPRKVRPPVVRKLRRPQPFAIRMNNGQYKEVTGEIVFKHGQYAFFIYLDPTFDHWTVCDVTIGAVISRGDRYKEAVKKAKKTILENPERYKEFVEKYLAEFKQVAN